MSDQTKVVTGWAATFKPFLCGGTAGCIATSCIQPLDTIKVSLQLQGEGGAATGAQRNALAVGRSIVTNEGVAGLYAGLSAGILRQVVYGSARLGLFRSCSDYLTDGGKEKLPFWQKAVVGLGTGAVASFIGNPIDLMLVRMQADMATPAASRRNYKHVGDALMRTVKEEGVATLWRGSTPTMLRAMAMNCGMLATYDQSREFFEEQFGVGLHTRFMASGLAGFFAAAATLPFDMLKVRIQKQVPDPKTGILPYKNVFHAAGLIFTKEGPMAFYKGFSTFYVRVAPHAVITLVAMDTLSGIYVNKLGSVSLPQI